MYDNLHVTPRAHIIELQRAERNIQYSLPIHYVRVHDGNRKISAYVCVYCHDFVLTTTEFTIYENFITTGPCDI